MPSLKRLGFANHLFDSRALGALYLSLYRAADVLARSDFSLLHALNVGLN